MLSEPAEDTRHPRRRLRATRLRRRSIAAPHHSHSWDHPLSPTHPLAPTRVLHTGWGPVQRFLLLYCGLSWLADACETMLLSFLGPAVACAWGASGAQQAALTSVVFAGMLLGVSTLGAVSDHVGRRRGFLFSALLLGAAGLASALAPSMAWLLLLRGLVGVALGGTPIAVTLFAEWCPSALRGRLLLLLQSFWTLGG